jgi:hypothetical protein
MAYHVARPVYQCSAEHQDRVSVLRRCCRVEGTGADFPQTRRRRLRGKLKAARSDSVHWQLSPSTDSIVASRSERNDYDFEPTSHRRRAVFALPRKHAHGIIALRCLLLCFQQIRSSKYP